MNEKSERKMQRKKLGKKEDVPMATMLKTVFPDIKRAGNFACRNSKQARIERII